MNAEPIIIAQKNGFDLYRESEHRYTKGTIKTVRTYHIRFGGTEVYQAFQFYRGGWTTKKDAMTALSALAKNPDWYVVLKPHMTLVDGGQAWRRVS